ALVGPVARIANAVRDAVEAADAERPIPSDRSAPITVGTVIAVVADRQPDVGLGRIARLARDEVDRPADRAGRENRRRAAAHDLDAADRSIEPDELIRVVERQLVDRIERQTVLHQADVTIAAVLNDPAG